MTPSDASICRKESSKRAATLLLLAASSSFPSGTVYPNNRDSPNEPNHLLNPNGNLTPRPLVLPCASNTDGCGTYRGRATFHPAPLHTVLHSICRPPDAFPPQPPTTRPACECNRITRFALRAQPTPARAPHERWSPKEFIPSSPSIWGFGTGIRLHADLPSCRFARRVPRKRTFRPRPGPRLIPHPAIVIGASDSAPVHSSGDHPPYAGSHTPRNAMRPMGSIVRSSRP